MKGIDSGGHKGVINKLLRFLLVADECAVGAVLNSNYISTVIDDVNRVCARLKLRLAEFPKYILPSAALVRARVI